MNNLQILEFNNQRILTTQQLAEVYETPITNIKMNFSNHKNNFVEGKHYYLLKDKELKKFKNQVNNIYLVDKHASHLYLWTERGANRHCKILDTDKAWEQFDNLEETYFRVKDNFMTPEKLKEAILNPDLLIKICTALKEEQNKNKALMATNSQLAVANQIMQPKADYFDELVDRNLLTNFRETAKQLNVKQKDFINFLINKKYIYKNSHNNIMPYAAKNNGLFEIKECFNDKTGWKGTQTLITPKGRETFRLQLKVMQTS